MKVVCCLKTGGDYNYNYVKQLEKQIPEEFRPIICFSNIPEYNNSGYDFIDLPGFWSKLNCFQSTGKTLYIDLDTLLINVGFVSEMNKVLEYNHHFFMLKPFNKKEKYASGIMAWKGDFSVLLKTITKVDINYFKWDQRYIWRKLKEYNVPLKYVNDIEPNIYSYKHHVVKDNFMIPGENKFPDYGILCFHGKPRPHEVREVRERYWS
jgi:hypothetical protein